MIEAPARNSRNLVAHVVANICKALMEMLPPAPNDQHPNRQTRQSTAHKNHTTNLANGGQAEPQALRHQQHTNYTAGMPLNANAKPRSARHADANGAVADDPTTRTRAALAPPPLVHTNSGRPMVPDQKVQPEEGRTAPRRPVPTSLTEPWSAFSSLVRADFPAVPTSRDDKPDLSLVAFDSGEWRFRNTVSFWVAVCFIEGSCLFLVGAISSIPKGLPQWKVHGLVTYGYFAGSLAYTGGAYLSWFEVINVGRKKRRFAACSGSSKAGFYGSLFYFVGALFYNVNCGVPLLHFPSEESEQLAKVWGEGLAGVLGSLFFVAAAIIEWWHNRDATPRQLVWWLCSSYFVGSVLVLVGASCTLGEYVGISLSAIWGVDAPYAVGSFAFLFGSWVAMRMWKTEAFGLGFIREINNLEPVAPMNLAQSSLASLGATVDDAADDEGNDSGALLKKTRMDRNDQIFLAIYVICGVLSILDICSLVAWQVDVTGGVRRGILFAEEILTSFSVYFAVHVMLLLATVVHRTPTVEPYNYLLWLLRASSVFFLTCSLLRWLKYYFSAEFNELEFWIKEGWEAFDNGTLPVQQPEEL